MKSHPIHDRAPGDRPISRPARGVLAILLLALLALPAISHARATNAARCPGRLTCEPVAGYVNCGDGAEGDDTNGWHCRDTYKGCRCWKKTYDDGSLKAAAPWFIALSEWGCNTVGPMQPQTVNVFGLTHQSGNWVRVWEAGDEPDGAWAELLQGVGAFFGWFELSLGNGPPEAIPAQILYLDLTMAPFLFEGAWTGGNRIRLDSSATVATGLYDATTQTVRFIEPVVCRVINDRFPQGQPMYLRPTIERVPGTYRIDLSGTLEMANMTAGVVGGTPAAWAQMVASPNPFARGTGILLTLPAATDVVVEAFDAAGRLVKRLASERLRAGSHLMPWDGRDAEGRAIEAGVYHLRARAGERTLATRVVHVK